MHFVSRYSRSLFGSIVNVRSSISTKSGRPPACEIASVVAMNVCGTVRTISPAWIPAAIKAKRSASVPLFTPTQYFASQYSANSFSRPSTSGPPMKPAVVITLLHTSSNSPSSSRCMVTRSTKGTAASCVISSPLIESPRLSFVGPTRRLFCADTNGTTPDLRRVDIFEDQRGGRTNQRREIEAVESLLGTNYGSTARTNCVSHRCFHYRIFQNVAHKYRSRSNDAVGADRDLRLDEDSGPEFHAIADVHQRAHHHARTKGAKISEYAMVLDIYVGTQKIAVPDDGTRADVAERQDYVPRPEHRVYLHSRAGVNYVRRWNFQLLEFFVHALPKTGARAHRNH